MASSCRKASWSTSTGASLSIARGGEARLPVAALIELAKDPSDPIHKVAAPTVAH